MIRLHAHVSYERTQALRSAGLRRGYREYRIWLRRLMYAEGLELKCYSEIICHLGVMIDGEDCELFFGKYTDSNWSCSSYAVRVLKNLHRKKCNLIVANNRGAGKGVNFNCSKRTGRNEWPMVVCHSSGCHGQLQLERSGSPGHSGSLGLRWSAGPPITLESVPEPLW